MPKPVEMFFAKVEDEILIVPAPDLAEAKERLHTSLQKLGLEREVDEVLWFKADQLHKGEDLPVYVVAENHLGMVEQVGEASAYVIDIRGYNKRLLVLGRSKEEVAEHMGRWIATTRSVLPPVHYDATELEEVSPWVYQLKGPTS